MSQVLYQVAEHLFETGDQIDYTIQREVVLMILFLVKVPTQVVPNAFLHKSLLDLWKIGLVKMEVLYQLGSLLAVVIRTQAPDEL